MERGRLEVQVGRPGLVWFTVLAVDRDDVGKEQFA